MSISELDKLITSFSFDHLSEFLRQKGFNGYKQYPTPKQKEWDVQVEADVFQFHEKYGVVLPLPTSSTAVDPAPLAVFAVHVKRDLTARSCRKKQYDLSRNCIRWLFSNKADAGLIRQGLFVFHDADGNFRFSLVSATPTGTKQEWSNFRRQTFFVEKKAVNRTFRDRMAMPWDSLEAIKKAFSVETLTKEFYTGLFDWYQRALKATSVVFPNDIVKDKKPAEVKSEQLIRLITRLMFVWFITRKHLVPEKLFDKKKLGSILKSFDPKKGDNYYRAILQNLFFATLNSEIPDRAFVIEGSSKKENKEHFDIKTLYRYYKSEFALPEKKVLELFGSIPFLNGGLFECLDRGDKYYDGFSREPKNQARVPNKFFFSDDEKEFGLITLLSRYNFTVDENAPGDEEVALDPELLGKVFENLLGAFNPETQVAARNATGSFYTPREIVNYMVDESLIAHLMTKCGEKHAETIRKLFTDGARPADDDLCARLDKALVTAKILDPACGSGAFPMGMLLRMVELLRILRKTPDSETLYNLKLELIENCIYGDDIQCIAVQISKLRFFISLVCEQTPTVDPKTNYGINPLPNLETKFVAADSLIGLPSQGKDALDLCTGNIAQLKKELWEIRHKHFMAKTYREKKKLRKQDKQKRDEIKIAVKQVFKPDKERLALLEKERVKVAASKWVKIVAPKEKQSEMFADLTTPKSEPAELTYDANEKRRKYLDAAIAREKKKVNVPATVIDAIADKLASWDPYDQNTSAPFSDPEWMFNVKDGFDIVIGNPPYIDSETMVQIYPGLRERLKPLYSTAKGNWDFFVVFVERGIHLLHKEGHLTYIIPNKLLSSPYAKEARRFIGCSNTPLEIRDYSHLKVFIEADVYPITIIVRRNRKHSVERIHIMVMDTISTFQRSLKLKTETFCQEDNWGKYFAAEEIMRVMTTMCESPQLSSFGVKVFGAATVSEAYKIKNMIKESGNSVLDKNALKLVNTGTIDPYTILWGICPTQYIKSRYVRPIILSNTLGKHYPTRLKQAKASKVIIAGMAKCVEAVYDNGFCLAGKSTCIIIGKGDFLINLVGILNSKAMKFYVNTAFHSFKMAGGYITISTAIIESLPVPNIHSAEEGKILTQTVKTILAAKKANPSADISTLEAKIDRLVYKHYGLKPEEIAIIEQSFKKPDKKEKSSDIKSEQPNPAKKEDGSDAMD